MVKTAPLFFLLFILASCLPDRKIPETVTIEGTKYISGFYDDLYPLNFIQGNDYYEIQDNKFRPVNHKKFTLIKFANDGAYPDVLYCAEPQWEQAHAYYKCDNNFIYYCGIGVDYADREPMIFAMRDIDREKYDELMTFAKENGYNPFSTNKNIETIRLSIPDRNKSPRLSFYKESNDGLFTSYKGYKFHITDGKLLLVYQYDYRNDDNGELVAVYVPDNIGKYFIEFLIQLTGNTGQYYLQPER